jgi:hypothetical protein
MILYLVTLFLAYAEALRDFRLISQHKPVDHVRAWTLRAILVVLSGLVCMVFGSDITNIVGAAFLFAAAHRFILNKKRKLDWRYINRGNEYDEFFVRTFSDYKPDPGHYKAGTAAYIAEGLISCAMLAW